jgi:hypothetical protein
MNDTITTAVTPPPVRDGYANAPAAASTLLPVVT